MSNIPTLALAHRTNTLKWLDYAIEYKANAVESDIYLGKGGQIWTAHDSLAPGTKIEEFITYAGEKLRESNHIVLWIFDLKPGMTSEKVGELRSLIDKHFPDNVWKFYCTNTAITYQLEPHIADFSKYEGVNYDADQRPNGQNTRVQEAWEWKVKNRVEHFIYSAGMTSLLPDMGAIERLREAKTFRSKERRFGMYSWTFNSMDSAQKTMLDLDLNGIMGNMDQSFGNLPQEIIDGKVRRRRLATRNDGINAYSMVP